MQQDRAPKGQAGTMKVEFNRDSTIVRVTWVALGRDNIVYTINKDELDMVIKKDSLTYNSSIVRDNIRALAKEKYNSARSFLTDMELTKSITANELSSMARPSCERTSSLDFERLRKCRERTAAVMVKMVLSLSPRQTRQDYKDFEVIQLAQRLIDSQLQDNTFSEAQFMSCMLKEDPYFNNTFSQMVALTRNFAEGLHQGPSLS